LLASREVEWVGADEQCTDAALSKGGKADVDLSFGASVESGLLQSQRARSRIDLSSRRFKYSVLGFAR